MYICIHTPMLLHIKITGPGLASTFPLVDVAAGHEVHPGGCDAACHCDSLGGR